MPTFSHDFSKTNHGAHHYMAELRWLLVEINSQLLLVALTVA